jgi:hypothetical protein
MKTATVLRNREYKRQVFQVRASKLLALNGWHDALCGGESDAGKLLAYVCMHVGRAGLPAGSDAFFKNLRVTQSENRKEYTKNRYKTAKK